MEEEEEVPLAKYATSLFFAIANRFESFSSLLCRQRQLGYESRELVYVSMSRRLLYDSAERR